MGEGGRRLRRRGVALLAVVAAAVLTASVVIARTHAISPDTTPGVASDYPPLVLQGELTERVPWAEIGATGSYDGREDADNRHEQLRAVYRGEPLYRLVGRVDDDDPTTFNRAKAEQGYGIKLFADDHYAWIVDSRTIVGETDWIVAKLRDGKPLPRWEGPYRFVGDDFISFRAGQSVRRLVRIRLLPGRVGSQTPQ
jgi:hypothetical protein